MINKSISIKFNDISDTAQLYIYEKRIIFKYNSYNITKEGDFLFLILKEIRRELENDNLFLLINGSRKDVYPSGSSLNGDMAYVNMLKKPAKREELVSIFEITDQLDKIGTIKEQEDFHKEWIESIK